MTRVKVCGLRHEPHLELCAELGVDYVGFVALAPKSPRDLPLDRVAALAEAAPVELETVLVTPSTDDEAVVGAAEAAGCDVVQLTGSVEDDLSARLQRTVGVEVWRAYTPSLDPTTEVERLQALADTCDAIVLDAMSPDGYGGSGHVLDWEHTRLLVQELEGFPVVLAGGLDPDNVAEAIDWVRPWCVDVSSALEDETGEKDPERIAAFVDAVEVRR